ncbi:PREDICTED: scavenger receptor class B member 1-like [Papilio xuthus]|uniref:Scavenger receptor class B member 1-like n=1 Tax=Papilio xuthus TaxID=66420 RepID=A0AAJ6ZQV6_PAPXU|nr:PREDICTED: scavenger receptor class B member 1-like [Papilio xuthus]
MYTESIIPTVSLNSERSSRTNSTNCVDSDSKDSDSGKESASDSFNSLIEDRVEENYSNCLDDCIDVKCTGTQYSVPYGEDQCKVIKKRSLCCNSVTQTAWGVLLIIISISGFVFSPLDFMLWEKLNMRPGLPPYEWWANPPDEVKMRAYIFNVTNHERFMKGLDKKLNLQEIGPIVYLEKLQHYDIKFNENSTLTYTAKRSLIYLPDENTYDLNATIIVPNLAVLGMASFLHDSNYFVRAAFRLLVNAHGSEFFVNRTLYEYLWDYRDPVLVTSKNIVPSLVPVDNMGFLKRMYSDFIDEVTVEIGSERGHDNFFQINRFRGEPQLPGYDPAICPDRIFGSTEGVMYHQHITKQDVLLYWRKTVCKLMPLYFESELSMDEVPLYRYNLSEVVFERVRNGTDCYDTSPSLPSGLSDASKCYFNFPIVVSYPHFYTGSPPKDHYVTGLTPDREKHNSYVVVEPITGVPFRAVARMQSNLRMHDLSLFTAEYKKFSNHVIPLFWAEYSQEGLPTVIKWTIYFMVVILPPLSVIIFILTLLLGSFLITRQMYDLKIIKKFIPCIIQLKNKNKTVSSNKIFLYEKESFIKLPS